LNLSVNPEFLDLGDDYYTPDMILSTWDQAESGKIPVSGAGYRGRFYGPGFDSIWTDMSEIVRPTRDGIHGREYISTSVDIGPKPMWLKFTSDGELLRPASRLLEIKMPAILDMPAWPVQPVEFARARAMAAKDLGTAAVVLAREARLLPRDLLPFIVPLFVGNPIEDSRDFIQETGTMAQLLDSPHVLEAADVLRAMAPEMILSVRMKLSPAAADRIIELSRHGLKVFHLCADQHGRERTESGTPGRHIKDALREVHGQLVQERLRDEITLGVSGGIALAEHMAKAIICGADLVAVDTALLIALGCRVCRDAHSGNRDEISGQSQLLNPCPVKTGVSDCGYAAQRMVNLMGAWHSQLIEVLGAMGLREVRRLRGEVGRAIFLEDIEKEAFGDLYQIRQ
jgi:hypothetical protein